jgi:tRNA A37 threonylcarbamoyladenosine modification protein TsaB
MGLKKSLDCDIYGVSVLEALALSIWRSDGTRKIMSAIPLGTKVCFQKFQMEQKRELKIVTMPCLVSLEKFIKELADDLESSYGLDEKLYQDVLAYIQTENHIVKRIKSNGENLASLIGLSGNRKGRFHDLRPIYISYTN